MSTWIDVQLRLEPRRPLGDLEQGFAAPVYDPVWFLGRQWQMGEHQGENAASPVRVEIETSDTPIESPPDCPTMSPSDTPAEAILEGEPDEWWTPGRRIRLGQAAAAALPAILPSPPDPNAPDDIKALLLNDLPPPYNQFDGKLYDGLAIFRHLDQFPALPANLFVDVPPAANHWDSAQLLYRAAFPCGDGVLDVPQHDGGDVDWWSVDAWGTLDSNAPHQSRVLMPARFRYPGAPLPRWWQIEDANVDIGGYPPDRSHFATMLLLDLLLSHSDDWFTFPVPAQTGSVVTLHRVTVTDVFGDEWAIMPPQEFDVPEDWSLFAVKDLGPRSLVLWPTVTTPLTGGPLEEIVLGVDEDANVMWTVEERAQGRQLSGTPPDSPPFQPRIEHPGGYAYVPSTTVPERWHPYLVDTDRPQRWFVQARLIGYATRPRPILRPEPLARLLYDEHAREGETVHQIDPSTVPSQGLRLDRRCVLARRMDGKPVLWIQRRRLPLLAPPVSGLRFDIFKEKA